jgi:hypothetical protein
VIYCDLDGVLVNFNKGVYQLFPDHEPTADELWPVVDNSPDRWFTVLEMMPEADLLWRIMNYHQATHAVTILTALPKSMKEKAEADKREWVKRNLGEHIPVICCHWSEKANYCKPGDILIDDRRDIVKMWNRAGGRGIHHTNVYDTIWQLRELGVN